MNRSRHDFLGGDPSDTNRAGEPIAIVGASCRLPGAPDLDAFWNLLIGGVDAVSEIPDDRWNKAQLFHPEKGQRGKAYTFAAGTIGDVKGFDPAFFGISPREAVQMDPQQRLALELAHEAIEDAGIDGSKLAGESVGVFVGASSWDYLNLHLDDVAITDAYSMIGITLCSIANRVSYAFDLRGPSFTVDTACSSSLVALHQACEALRLGQMPAALVGGVSLLLAPQSYVGFSAASMLSPRGRCHTFDARADGYVRGEGGGFVLLKPLSAAIAAGDPIRAVIRGTGVNSDGRTAGMSLPSQDAQARLLEDVYDRFGLDPADLVYVEAHGTGTPAGDPIECGALSASLAMRHAGPLPIGSVKTNVGHLEAGSGMAGLIKAMLVAEHGEIPPSLNFETPNPNIRFDALNLQPVTEPVGIAPRTGPALIGVNSFGFGGTNAHAVIERALPAAQARREPADTALPPFLLSARSDGALKALAGTWRGRIAGADEGALPGLVRATAFRREQHKQRLVVPAPDRERLLAGLDAYLEGRPGGYAQGSAARGKVGFVFSGNGSQWAGMAADAMAGSAAFRSALATVDAVLSPILGWSAADALVAADADRLRNTEVAQPLLFAVQVALVMSLRDAGIEADGCIGHSVGEVAAAWASGALSLEQAARVICARSSAQQRRHGVGAMAVLGMGASEANAALDTPALAGLGLSVAANNSASAVTIAGPSDAIDAAGVEAKARGWRFTRLDLDYAFHNAIMDPIAPELAHDLEGLVPAPGKLPFFSTVSGAEIDGAALDADYWWRNIREPVLFAEAARAMVADGYRIFVEIGPHAVLQSYVTDALRQGDASGQVVPSLARRPLRGDPLAIIAGRVHAAGADMRRASVFRGPQSAEPLPRYPWQREPYWIARSGEATDVQTVAFDHPLLGVRPNGDAQEWRRHVGLAIQPWLADHAVGGAAVMPAAALLDIGLAAARSARPDAGTLELLDIEIGRALALEAGVLRELRTRIDSADGHFSVASKPRLTDEPWTVHMTGRIVEADAAAPVIESDGPPIGRIGRDDLYALADRLGLVYGPAFRPVTGVDLLGDADGIVRLGDSYGFGLGFLLPPDLTDGALQGLLALAAQSLGSDAGVMPWRFGRVRLFRPTGAVPASARLKVTRVGPRSVRADIQLIDAWGAVVAELTECWFVRVLLGRQARVSDGFYHQRLIPGADAFAASVAPVPLPAVAPTDKEAALLVDAYASAVAAEALLGFAPDGVIDRPALIASGTIAPAGRPLLDQLLRWLGEDELASESEGVWRLVAEDVPPADAILRTLLFDRPRSVGTMALMALAGEALPAMLAEGPDATPTLPTALREQFVEETPAIAPLVDAVAEIAAAWPEGRAFRVLEIGAGRGTLTRRLIRRLDHPGFDLVAATDEDDLPMLADRLNGLPNARAVAWNPAEEEGAFDLVVGLFSLTLAGIGLDAIRRKLAPGGRLIVAEPEPSRLWSLLRPGGVAALGAERWRTRLADAGFAESAGVALHGGDWPVSLVDARVAPAQAEAIAAGTVLLFGDADAALTAGIEARGGAVVRHPLSALAAFVANAGAVQPIVIACPTGMARLPEALASIATLAALPVQEQSWPVTVLVIAARDGDPIAGAVSGARRVLANEAVQVAARLVRIDPALGDAAARLAAEIVTPDAEQEIAWTTAGRIVPRLVRGLPRASVRPTAYRLAVERPGLLDTLGWEGAAARLPGAGELAIEVRASGLNFRDVMWAMGLLPDEALLDGFAGATLGLECAGIVTAVGDGVADFAPGDRVMAFAPASIASHTVTAAHAVMRMPPALDFTSAATVPVAFLTVAYSVGHLARLEAGETILIHGGAGGVGLAAIQWAKHVGAIVFATAGSPAKRALLKRLGVDHVLDSRSLAFADEVMRLTNGEGVDVVLNSLSGEAMRRSLALMKPFGRFLELGKRDFYENSAVGLRPFRHNVTYFAIDADQLPLRRPKLAARLFAEISDLFAKGALRPLPHRVFDHGDAGEAFRLMQSSGHVGKIVLAPGAVPPPVAAAPATLTLAGEGAYVVTGGLAGFGLQAARWLADHGARHLALLGRRGMETPGAIEAVAALAEAGIVARAYAVDIADEPALAETLEAIRAAQGPIRGVVHAAVAMDDALLGQLDATRFAHALAPKLGGAEALDRLTRGDPVDLFVLFSSVTTPLGNPGQANYVAANSAIEAVAERRHAEGLPALAVQWGPIGDAGYLVRTQEVSELLSRQLGSAHLKARDALDALPELLASGLPVAGVANIRWGALKARLPLLASPVYAGMGGAAGEEAAEIDLRALLASCSPEEARDKATAMLIEEVARIMKLAPDRIEAHRPLAELGMDSLMAVELRLAVEQRFGVSVPLLALSEGATLSAMAGRILRSLGSDEDAEPAPAAAQLAERIKLHEGGKALLSPETLPPTEPGFAAASATLP